MKSAVTNGGEKVGRGSLARTPRTVRSGSLFRNERRCQMQAVKRSRRGRGDRGRLLPFAVASEPLDVLERQLPGGGRCLAELAADLARRDVADRLFRSVGLGPDGA